VSREELVQAYASGRISRRALLRGLAAAGVSASALAAHAAVLSEPATADHFADFYPRLPRLDCSSLPNIPRVQERCVEINERLVPFGKFVCTGERPKCSGCVMLSMCRQVGVTDTR